MTDHPITPPYELVQQWATSSPIQYSDESWAYELFIAHQAAHWGADHELEACCEWLLKDPATHDLVGREARYLDFELRAARRPKPPSLKEQALLAIDTAVADGRLSSDVSNVVRRALEQSND